MLVHCKAGISRSATVCIAYIMWFKHWTMEVAYQFLKSKRALIAPNLNFMRQLLEFQHELEENGRACVLQLPRDPSATDDDVTMSSLTVADVTSAERKWSRSARSSASSYASAVSCTCECDDVTSFQGSTSLTSSSLSSNSTSSSAKRSARSVTSQCSMCSNCSAFESDVITHDAVVSPLVTPLSAYHTPLQSANVECACHLRHSGASHLCEFSAFVFQPPVSLVVDDVTRPSRGRTACECEPISAPHGAMIHTKTPAMTSDEPERVAARPNTALPVLFPLPVTTSSCSQQLFSFDFGSAAVTSVESAAAVAAGSPVVCSSPQLLSPS